MRSDIKPIFDRALCALASMVVVCMLTGCPLVRGTGQAVRATGEGVGHAVEGVGDAVANTAHELAP